MEHWQIWLGAAGALVVFEIMTGTFYLLMIALGLSAGALCAALGGGFGAQLITAAIIGSGATFALRMSKYGKFSARQGSQRNPDVQMDIGQTVKVEQWSDANPGARARVHYRGAAWNVILLDGAATPGEFSIVELDGSTLLVKPLSSNSAPRIGAREP